MKSIRRDYLPFGRPDFTDREIDAVTRVMRSGWVGMGPEVIAFEEELSRYIGASQVVTVNSCTSALFLALLISGVKEGDEVICPSLTWCATANAALYLGAKVVFCDIDPQTLCVEQESLMRCLTPRTRAVMVVHFGGRTVDVMALRKLLPERVHIIEDAAHALGATFSNGSKVGSSGNLTCFSFYANKNLSTAEGGAVALNHQEFADQLRSLRQNAMPNDAWKRFNHAHTAFLSVALTDLGYKMNYTDLQACIGRVQLARFDTMQTHRRTLVDQCLSRLGNRFLWQTGIQEPSHARHLLCIQLDRDLKLSRNELLLALRQRNIGASIHYSPLHHMPLYGHLAAVALPNTDAVTSRILTLPISAKMSMDDVNDVCDHVLELIEK